MRVVASRRAVGEVLARALRNRGIAAQALVDDEPSAAAVDGGVLVVVPEEPDSRQTLVGHVPATRWERVVVIGPPGGLDGSDTDVDWLSPSASLDDLVRTVSGARAGAAPTRAAPHASHGPTRRRRSAIEDLTHREQEILAHLVAPIGHDAIAAKLGISPNTVRTHVRNIYEKIGVHNRIEAARVALSSGLVASVADHVGEGDVA